MGNSPRILCFGEALWDMPPGERVPGGAPMNVALRLAGAGHDVRLLSRVGDDAPGRELCEYIAGQGLGTTDIQVDQHYPTGVVTVDNSDPENVRYDIAEPVAWDFIDVDQYVAARGPETDVVVFGSLAARNAVSRGSLLALLGETGLAVFDVNLRPPFADRETIELLLGRSDWVKLNETELATIADWYGLTGTPDVLVRGLQDRLDLGTICITLGSEGVLLAHGAQLFRQPAFAVPVVDTIGCGDAFLGSWLASMLADVDPQQALCRAAAVAALVAAGEGANPPLAEDAIQSMLER